MSEITIIVGTPGAGKTLYTMSELRKEFSNPIEIEGQEIERQVYYHNIPGVTVDEWTELKDVTTWHTLPVGSVIIIDEAHEAFPATDHKKEKPEHILRAADLRHRGHTLVLITQHPTDLHIFLRRRCTRFLYIKRPLTQGDWATVYQWPEFEEKYRDEYVQKKSDKFSFTYPKDAFGTYKSSQLHTKKKYIPKSARTATMYGVIAIFLLAGAGYYLFQSFQDKSLNTEQYSLDKTLIEQVGNHVVTTIEDYFSKQEPRISGLPHTAPVYDGLTDPTTFPRYNCISTKTKCHCYTQQATRIDTTEEICRKIIEFGYFDPTLEGNS